MFNIYIYILYTVATLLFPPFDDVSVKFRSAVFQKKTCCRVCRGSSIPASRKGSSQTKSHPLSCPRLIV